MRTGNAKRNAYILGSMNIAYAVLPINHIKKTLINPNKNMGYTI